ncbi:RIP metalloprotease RseP [Erythrobacter sp. THAF29]|uniref:RIP metalloprotease RseP n=1 Tax=Erythrobacter sp. THAF29 TaxID=2587851 RepID=UPI001268B2A5|nr:RIP metalloprotease RseP [Erythrobacter sp. THAF29]QFT77447.1 Metalloprotease MmpA [Erythrobacter sp. THAF29]
MFESPPFWMYLVGFLLVLGPLITLHELGHYLVGRWFGVEAEAFSIGFGKEIWGRTDKRGTRWRISALPLGGYVQFKGDMNPASVPDPDAPKEAGSFQEAALWKRALIVAAGPIANLLITIAIFASIFSIYGKLTIVGAEDSRTAGEFSETSVAAAAGMQLGDTIIAIDGDPVEDFEDIRSRVMIYPEKEMVITVDREGEIVDIPLVTERVEVTDAFGNTSVIGRLGVGPSGGEYVLEEVSVLESVPLAVTHSWDVLGMMLTGLKQIILGERSIKELGGPIKIAKYSGEQLSMGLISFLSFTALISLNLAFINFLPIPALDGGHLAFYAAEAVRGNPVGPVATEWAYRTGILVVLVFMVVVTVNDVASLSFFGRLFGS